MLETSIMLCNEAQVCESREWRARREHTRAQHQVGEDRSVGVENWRQVSGRASPWRADVQILQEGRIRVETAEVRGKEPFLNDQCPQLSAASRNAGKNRGWEVGFAELNVHVEWSRRRE